MNCKVFGSCHGLTEVLPWQLPGGTKENYKNPVRITTVPAKIRTQHIPKQKSGVFYHYTNCLIIISIYSLYNHYVKQLSLLFTYRFILQLSIFMYRQGTIVPVPKHHATRHGNVNVKLYAQINSVAIVKTRQMEYSTWFTLVLSYKALCRRENTILYTFFEQYWYIICKTIHISYIKKKFHWRR
jgi:hypothetical protein